VKKRRALKDEGEAYPDHVYEPVPPLGAVLTKPVVLSIVNYLWLAFIDIALRALQPLFLAAPIHLGGLGMSPATIGLCLGTFGLLDGAVQGLFFPKVLRYVGLKRLFVMALFCFIPVFTMFPIINHFAREWGRSPAIWVLIVFQLMINCITEMAFGTYALLNVYRRNDVAYVVPVASTCRLRLLIHNLLRAESASTRERKWYWTNHCLTRSSTRPSDFNIPLRIHATERLVGWTRSLRCPRHIFHMRFAPCVQASGESMGTQTTKHPYLT